MLFVVPTERAPLTTFETENLQSRSAGLSIPPFNQLMRKARPGAAGTTGSSLFVISIPVDRPVRGFSFVLQTLRVPIWEPGLE